MHMRSILGLRLPSFLLAIINRVNELNFLHDFAEEIFEAVVDLFSAALNKAKLTQCLTYPAQMTTPNPTCTKVSLNQSTAMPNVLLI